MATGVDNSASKTASEILVSSTEERAVKRVIGRKSLDISEVTRPLDDALDFELETGIAALHDWPAALLESKLAIKEDYHRLSHLFEWMVNKILVGNILKLFTDGLFQMLPFTKFLAELWADADGGFRHKFPRPFPVEGTTAFGSRHGGEGSEDGGVGPFHRIPVDEGNHGSARSLTEMEQQASPTLNNMSFTSDQSDEQPPPNGSLSNIQIETEPILEEPGFDWSDMHKTFLLVSVDEVLATSTIKFGAAGSVPENARILLSSAQLCSVAATFLCSCGYILERSRKAKLARMMTAGGVVAATCTLVVVTGSLLANFK